MDASQPLPRRPAITPCIKVCMVDGQSGLCLGCFRTLPEIARWERLTDDERKALMAALPGRRSRISPEKLGDA
jgi:predicted Fe-S protein YdhL (DUF1289 family)